MRALLIAVGLFLVPARAETLAWTNPNAPGTVDRYVLEFLQPGPEGELIWFRAAVVRDPAKEVRFPVTIPPGATKARVYAVGVNGIASGYSNELAAVRVKAPENLRFILEIPLTIEPSP